MVRIVFLFSMLFLVSVVECHAIEQIEIEIVGVEGEIKKNVLAMLSLHRLKDNDRLRGVGIRRLHRKAKAEIKTALEPFGYYQPTISSSLKEKDKTWQAEYTIDPGPPVRIDHIDARLVGPGAGNQKLVAAMAKLKLEKDGILNQQLYEEEKKRLIRAALAAGYLDASFATKTITIDAKTNRAAISLVLDSGEQYHFGKTTSVQQILTQDLLDRYLPYKAGDPYSSKKLFQLQSILYRTDYFSKVVVRSDLDQVEDYAVPVNIELVPPEHYNRYSLGAGYATDTGIRGKIDWANRLFNRRGHKMSASLQLAELENTLSVHFEIPRQDPRYDTLLHSLSYQDRTWQGTDTRLLTASVSRAYSGPKFKLSGGLELRDEVYDVGDTSGESTLLIPSLNCGLVFADNILHTRNGLQASVGFLGGVDGLVSDVNFFQSTLGGKAIISFGEEWRLLGRGNVGVTLVDSIDNLPPSLRFYTGGDNSIRGYSYRSIGTRDSAGEIIGGRYLVVGSIELERHIKDQWSLATFWDGGTATDDLSLNFFQGAGLGVRFRLPFGQVRLDLASAVSEDGYPLRVHLTVGGDL